MDPIVRKFQLSCDTFWGYNISIDLSNPGFSSIDDVIKYILNSLRSDLKKMNLDVLRERLDKVYNNYHIHNMNEIQNLKRTNKDEIIYVCRH